MRPLKLLVIALAFGAGPARAEPLEPPTVRTTIQVERTEDGSCSEVHAGKAGGPAPLAMTDICHGWSSATCADKLLVVGAGVTEDQAQVLFTGENRVTDVVALVDAAVGARWPRHEHLHLSFGAPRCVDGAMVLPVSGSHLLADSTGSASGFSGELRIAGPDDHSVRLEAER
ncbi:MAG: hypothetical protein QM608_18765 [Caulobacter sp.]